MSECGIQVLDGDARARGRAGGVAAAVAGGDVADYGIGLGDTLVMTVDSHARVAGTLRDARLRRASDGGRLMGTRHSSRELCGNPNRRLVQSRMCIVWLGGCVR